MVYTINVIYAYTVHSKYTGLHLRCLYMRKNHINNNNKYYYYKYYYYY